MMKQLWFISILLSSLLLTSCHHTNIIEKYQAEKFTIPANTPLPVEATETTSPVVTANVNDVTGSGQRITEIGTNQYTKAVHRDEKLTTQHSTDDTVNNDIADINLNFQGADINEFIKVVLNDILQQNFIIDPDVSGKVTVETANPVTRQQLWVLFEEILAINNNVLIRSGETYRIVPRDKALREKPSWGQETGTDDGYRVRIVPLQFISAAEMQKVLAPFARAENIVRIDTKRNLLVLSGTTEELQQLQETIDLFDVNWMRGMSTGLYPLRHVDAKTIKTELDAILAENQYASADGSYSNSLVRTLAIERLNSILLIGLTINALREAELWLYRLDRPGEREGQNLYVYKVQNAKATELADILGHIFKNKDNDDNSTGTRSLAPDTTPRRISSAQETRTGDTPPPARYSATIGLPSVAPVEIIADDTRNALVILSSSKDYKMVAAAIQKLDVVPLQVLIEASIMEVTLRDELNYGVEWFFKNRISDSLDGVSQLDLGSSGISALSPSFSYTVVTSANNVRLALNVLEEESQINVLSSPSLMVLDNKTATINIGNEIPVATRQSTSNIDPDAPTVNEIEFRSTGISLTVTPRVNDSGLVTMEIKQEVSEAVGTDTSNIDSPTIQQREIESTVAVNSGETIVLGGLMRNNTATAEDGIPGLSKIPVFGKLFSQSSNEMRRAELIVMITPRVVRNTRDARQVTDEFRRKTEKSFSAISSAGRADRGNRRVISILCILPGISSLPLQ